MHKTSTTHMRACPGSGLFSKALSSNSPQKYPFTQDRSIFIYHLRCWEVWPTAMRGEFCTGISNHRTFLSMSGENLRWTETSFKLFNNLCHQKVLIIRKSNHLNWTACRLWSCPSKVSANEDIQQRGEFQNILRWHFIWVFRSTNYIQTFLEIGPMCLEFNYDDFQFFGKPF